jgi:eukaryotic-like serine/threonine-protein kinase
MALATGIRLGCYEILAPLGAGGMGEVYRATDTKLGRAVALKVLPDVFARDAQCMARFRREAQVLASLNHPNIATIHGLEESNESRVLVMELVEGPTLADRIAQGPIPIDEALPIAKQIADGLEYAHERGIIHRDLKPANVKVRPDDTVKILDFGLAKALEETPAAGSINTSPTVSAAATREGIILGTAAYMSPEQARGKPVDRRCDIWSFGAVLFEMLTGKQAFPGEDVSQTLAAVIMKEPDWSLLPGNLSGPVGRLLRRCLTKDAKQRLRDIGEARVAIHEVIAHPETAQDLAAQPTVARPTRSRCRRALPWALAGVLFIATVAGLTAYFWLAPSSAPVVIADVSAPKGTHFVFLSAPPPALSPDGRALVFSARDANNTTMLWVRRLDASSVQPLPGTEDPVSGFWSPDSRRIGFYAHHKLQAVEVSGGQPVILSDDLPQGIARGGTWNREGVVLFDQGSEIYRVMASGGAAAPVITRDPSRYLYCLAPKFLPDGKHFLYAAANPGSVADTYYASLDGKENRPLVRGGGAAVYSSGFLIYAHGTALIAQPFDPERGQLRGTVRRIAEQIRQGVFSPYFDASQNGVLVYQTAGRAAGETQLAWFERSGKRLAFIGAPAVYYDLRLSRDARRLAFSAGNPKSEIWVDDLVRGVRMRLTFDPDTDKGIPVWSPDGSRVLFSTVRGSKARVGIYEKASNGASAEELLLASDGPDWEVWATDWSPDGRFVLLARGDMLNNSEGDMWVLPLTGKRKPSLFVHAAGAAYDGQFSPDGRWVAYTSRESGRAEVYVVPFDAARFMKGSADTSPAGKWQVSSDGASVPRWRRDGRELFYLRPDNTMMAVEVEGKGSSFEVGRSQPLFTVPASPFEITYDVALDGRRFVLSFAPEDEGLPLTLVLNWPALLMED